MWPSKFSRYILSEVLTLSLIMLCGLTTVIMLGVVMQQLIAEGLGITAFIKMLPYATLVSLQFAAPSTLLFAVCSVYGRISADNEIVAVKSAGVNPLRTIAPAYIMALIISPIVVLLIDVAVSWGQPGLKRVALHSLEEIVYGYLRTNGSYGSSSGFLIYVDDVQDRWLIRPTIFMNSGTETNTIIAEKASISLDEESEKLVIELVDWESDAGTTYRLDGGQESIRVEMPLEKAARKGGQSQSISQVSMSDMSVAESELQRETQSHEQALLSRNSIALLTGRIGMLEDEFTANHNALLQDIDKRHARLKMEPWRRWALGFSCFSFVFLGVPLAITMKTADYWMSFGVCFLPVLIIYYPLFALGVDRAKNGVWPSYSPFVGNLVLIAVGLFYLRKVYRS